MKKVFLVCSLAFGAVALGNVASAQTVQQPEQTSKAQMEFDKEVHDYGSVKKGGNGVCEFTVKNTGTEALIIERTKGSCGCTVPSRPEDPIPPGGTAKISVKYDTNRVGPINRTVTVFSNAGTKTLRIRGTVVGEPQGSAPANPSVAPTTGGQ